MQIKEWVARLWAAKRVRDLSDMGKDAVKIQEKLWRYLVNIGKNTAFGQEHDFQNINNISDFQKKVPIRNYESLLPWLSRVQAGEANILWRGKARYFAKTSGTTAGAKYLPISAESIPHHVRGARDLLLSAIYHNRTASFLSGKMLFLSGSPELDKLPSGIPVGRLSGIVNHWIPEYLRTNQIPDYQTNCIENWEEKVQAVLKQALSVDLRFISGIPPWVLQFFDLAKQKTGKSPLQIWPNLTIYVQGGVDFRPYQPMFDEYFRNKVTILETFPASEGFFAIQDNPQQPDLLLLADNGITYEFVPLAEYGNPDAKRLWLKEVQLNTQYAMIISTNAGLWAYDIGDTVRFTSLNPPRIRVTGRVKQFLSAFGEHIIEEEINNALIQALNQTHSKMIDCTVAPLVLDVGSRHDWFIEFETPPEAPLHFLTVLDNALRKQNPYYGDLRSGNILLPPRLIILKSGACAEYMRSVGRLGGQNKFNRLTNLRQIADKLEPLQNACYAPETI